MASTEFGDRAAITRLKQELNDAVGRAHALAWAVARLEGRQDRDEVERVAREALLGALSMQTAPPGPNVVNFPKQEPRAAESAPPRAADGANAQEMLLAILRESEASVRELHTALEDSGYTISPGNLSVILSRLNQAGLIERTGRGVYKYAK